MSFSTMKVQFLVEVPKTVVVKKSFCVLEFNNPNDIFKTLFNTNK